MSECTRHVEDTIATYDRIAPDYAFTATADMRRSEERSMWLFLSLLPGRKVLVPGCGDGRDSRHLTSLGLETASFDLSPGMLEIARKNDPHGTYLPLDLREMQTLDGSFDGIWANGSLYHLTKAEFAGCVRRCRRLLAPGGVLYLSMKEGEGERFEEGPLPGYPGGNHAWERL